MEKEYVGTIVEESLEDNRILNELEISEIEVSNEENPAERWHLYRVKVSEHDIEKLSRIIKKGKWYMHFWKGSKVIAIFRDKKFEFDYYDKSTWKKVIGYGLKSVGIPGEQLDFPIEEETFKGFVLSESLKDQTILNEFNVIKVIVENHPEYEGEQKIWHDFKLEIDNSKINEVCKKISKEIKKTWYAHFWNNEIFYVVLPSKVFKMPREDGEWKSPQYEECKKYAIEHGVEERYLTDFFIED